MVVVAAGVALAGSAAFVALHGLRPRFPAENISKALVATLRRRLGGDLSGAEILARGGGEYWTCDAKHGASRCLISCFRGPSYLATLSRDGEDQAYARTHNAAEIIAVVGDWLRGQAPADLHKTHDCVDWCMRALGRVQDELTSHREELRTDVQSELYQRIADIYHLEFKHDARTCDLSINRETGKLHARFTWDETDQFEYNPDDHKTLATILVRWICETAKPSAIADEFPEIELGDLAKYYEAGRPVEGEFLHSWDLIDQFYEEDAAALQRRREILGPEAAPHVGTDPVSLLGWEASGSPKHG